MDIETEVIRPTYSNDKKAKLDFQSRFIIRLVIYYSRYIKPIGDILKCLDLDKIPGFDQLRKLTRNKYSQRLRKDVLDKELDLLLAYIIHFSSYNEEDYEGPFSNDKIYFLFHFFHFMNKNKVFEDNRFSLLFNNDIGLKYKFKDIMNINEIDVTDRYKAFCKQIKGRIFDILF